MNVQKNTVVKTQPPKDQEAANALIKSFDEFKKLYKNGKLTNHYITSMWNATASINKLNDRLKAPDELKFEDFTAMCQSLIDSINCTPDRAYYESHKRGDLYYYYFDFSSPKHLDQWYRFELNYAHYMDEDGDDTENGRLLYVELGKIKDRLSKNYKVVLNYHYDEDYNCTDIYLVVYV